VTLEAQRSRRGRAILAWGIGVFVGVQLMASVVVDYRWFRWRYPMYQEQNSRYEAITPPPNIIFLGSSRTGCIVNDTEVTKVLRDLTGDSSVRSFNSALGWGDPIVCERVLHHLIERGARPRFVVVECCPEGVNQRTSWLTGYVTWLLRWDDLPEFGRELLVSGNMVRFAGGHFLPLYVYRDPIRRKLRADAKAWYEGGDMTTPVATTEPAPTAPGSPEKWQRAIADTLRQAQAAPPAPTAVPEIYRRGFNGYRPGGNSAVRLERLIGECRAHGIEPIILSVPLSQPHREQYTPEIEAAFQAYIGEVTRKYSCHYVDFRDRLPDKCFSDHHHGTSAGSLAFSRMFAMEVLAPLWTGTTSRAP
jgi:hypothetical protein